MAQSNVPQSTAGHTMVELLVAIAIAGIVTSLCFGVYIAITSGLLKQSHTSANINERILAKKQIDRQMHRLTTVHRFTKNEVAGSGSTPDSAIALRFTGNQLLCNSDTLRFPFVAFSFSLVNDSRNRNNQNAILLWEGVLAKSNLWIGGATPVYAEKK